MRTLKLLAVLFLFTLPAAALGGVSTADLPATSTWYFHADFNEMRTSDAGRGLFEWLNKEVFSDIEEETGVDLGEEADRVTAYSAGEEGFVMIVEGSISQATQDKALAAAATAEKLEPRKHKGKVYYYMLGDGEFDTANVEVDDLDDEVFFSFAIDNKLIVASSEERMRSLIANRGKVTGSKSHSGALFVLTAERSLIQAGLNTSSFDTDKGEGGFKSNVMRNTKQIAMMIADVGGKIAIEAQLVTEEPEVAESLASVVRGLIALQALSDDMDPNVAEFLRGTRVQVDSSQLKISIALTPAMITAALDDA
jgi:hypothetical protein